ncbi:gamma-glutamylaminecyclotransferase A-like isoform X2 [Dreissena polymorpha]|uniref:gamma-glutamylaminecyclotransferase A-like isoform X2 n=1 Tax=Dreissena polymorpha TaxID=45954 RepID=UPI002264E8BC|nr:gamma-glutamylaminecyclotransferase A-like isoform X2 [Dreissena polymorpha]
MKHIIFVYGTLKTGLHNHHLMTTGSKGHCCYLGTAVTSGKFPLIVATRFNIPFLLFAPDHGYHVAGELYEVDDAQVAALDKLEGHPHRYERRRTDVRVTSGNARDGTPINKAVENDDPAALGEANGNFVKTTNCIRNLPLDVSNDVTTKIDGQVRITAGQVISAHTYFLVAYQPHLLALPHLVSYDGGFVTPPADASDDLRRETFREVHTGIQ